MPRFPVRPTAALALAIALAPTTHAADEPTLAELQARIDALAAQVEQQQAAGPAGTGNTTLGGYGEHHFNNVDGKDEVDAHRFVLFIGHQYNERVRLFSELEVEHGFIADNSCEVEDLNGDGIVNTGEIACASSPGEVELEQAYVDVKVNDRLGVKVGQFLLPVGQLNETHEPDTFYGVERNIVENAIIPTTWWETGVMAHGELAEGLSYALALHSGLNDDTAAGFIRDARQKSAKAVARDWAMTGRLQYQPATAYTIGLTAQQQEDITQGVADLPAMLLAVDGVAQFGPVTLKAVLAQWDIDNLATGREQQDGLMFEAGWKIVPTVGVFARTSIVDNAAGNDGIDTETTQNDVGVNWWLHERVVVKADYQDQDGATDVDGFNLGVGWSF